MPPIRRPTRKDRLGANQIAKKPRSDALLPLVERTNNLSLEEFLSLYVPTSELRFRKQNHATAHNITNIEEHKSSSGLSVPLLPEKETGSDYILELYTAATIPASQLDECYELIELTSSDAYKHSSFGWSASDKKKEMKLPDMKYMILRQCQASVSGKSCHVDGSSLARGGFLGFLEFMVTYEDGKEVIYCYEIHLVPNAQRKRLGEELMARFERIGQRIGLEKAMLTVFKSNDRAAVFYDRLGYTEDENSPQPRRLRNGTVKEADYRIMSKKLRGHCE